VGAREKEETPALRPCQRQNPANWLGIASRGIFQPFNDSYENNCLHDRARQLALASAGGTSFGTPMPLPGPRGIASAADAPDDASADGDCSFDL